MFCNRIGGSLAFPSVALLGLLLCGCPESQRLEPGSDDEAGTGHDAVQSDSGTASYEAPVPAPSDQPGVTLEIIDESSFAELLRRKRGSVVLVDFWAKWCIPCMELFPHTVQLHERFGEQGLSVVSISLDDPEDSKQWAAVLEFLRRQDATFENFISRHYGGETNSFKVFGITGGSLPHLKLFDRQGKLFRTFSSAQETIEPEQIDAAVEELLIAE